MVDVPWNQTKRFLHIVQSNRNNSRLISLRNETLTGSTTLEQSGYGSNGNEDVL